jgi:hypothetical protein
MWREIEDLELLEALKRIKPEEERLLAEYRRLLNKILLLPGFEFTATFGFHILAIFPEDTSIRKLEHLLLTLNVPEDKLNLGSSEVGATTDVLQAYEILHEAGALVIGAHVNSTHGIAMQGFPFGGQTKISYTQSSLLHALEATDLDNTSRRSTARFFSGAKAEYPRRMHIIQGSDAHRLTRDPERPTNLGVGDRHTEMQLPEVSFQAIRAVLEGTDFSRTRPAQPAESAYDFVLACRENGNNLSQSFHERLATRRSRTNGVLQDVVAFANTGGGTIFIGLDDKSRGDIVGVPRPDQAMTRIADDVQQDINPKIEVSTTSHRVDSKFVIAVTVPEGSEKPYALGNGEIYVRRESGTAPANRDDIVQMVRSSLLEQAASQPAQPSNNGHQQPVAAAPKSQAEPKAIPDDDVPYPRTGVEIMGSQPGDGETLYTMRDLRNHKAVESVTRSSSRSLWHYAIVQREDHPVNPDEIRWDGQFGFIKSRRQRGITRYDLAYRTGDTMQIFYGVTEKGLTDEWRKAVDALTATAN